MCNDLTVKWNDLTWNEVTVKPIRVLLHCCFFSCSNCGTCCLRWYCRVAPSKNGLLFTPNGTGFSFQLTLNSESLSPSFTLTCKDAFSRSPRKTFWDIHVSIVISQRSGFNGGPMDMQSLMLIASGCDLALAPNTMRTFLFSGLFFATCNLRSTFCTVSYSAFR